MADLYCILGAHHWHDLYLAMDRCEVFAAEEGGCCTVIRGDMAHRGPRKSDDTLRKENGDSSIKSIDEAAVVVKSV